MTDSSDKDFFILVIVAFLLICLFFYGASQGFRKLFKTPIKEIPVEEIQKSKTQDQRLQDIERDRRRMMEDLRRKSEDARRRR